MIRRGEYKISGNEEISIKDIKEIKEKLIKLEEKNVSQVKKIEQTLTKSIQKLADKTNNQNKTQEDKLLEQDNRLGNLISENIKKAEQQSNKEFVELGEKLDAHITNSDQKFQDITTSFNQNLNSKYETLDNKLKDGFTKFGQAVDGRFKTFERKVSENITRIEDKINSVLERMAELREDFSNEMKRNKEEFDTKDLVLRDIEEKHNDDNEKFRNQLKPVLEELKSQQDLVKITLDVLKKQIYDSAKEWISNEMKAAVKNKEREILMNIWIKEMKEIIGNVDKMKKMPPKEIKLQLDEISSTIESFKQKFIK